MIRVSRVEVKNIIGYAKSLTRKGFQSFLKGTIRNLERKIINELYSFACKKNIKYNYNNRK